MRFQLSERVVWTMSDTKLLPCPFCGGEAKVCNGSNEIVGSQYLVRCKGLNCTLRPKTEWHETLDEAVRHWNTRKPIDKVVEQLEERKGVYIDENGKELFQEDYFIDIDDAIEIVRKGGVE